MLLPLLAGARWWPEPAAGVAADVALGVDRRHAPVERSRSPARGGVDRRRPTVVVGVVAFDEFREPVRLRQLDFVLSGGVHCVPGDDEAASLAHAGCLCGRGETAHELLKVR